MCGCAREYQRERANAQELENQCECECVGGGGGREKETVRCTLGHSVELIIEPIELLVEIFLIHAQTKLLVEHTSSKRLAGQQRPCEAQHLDGKCKETYIECLLPVLAYLYI